jgi:hypothetical protein
MTDRHAGYIVALEKDIREDDAEAIINAIQMVRGVLSVEPIVADGSLWLAEQRARDDYREKLWRVLYPKKDEA